LNEEQQAAVRASLRAGTSVSELARGFGTSRQTIMRVRDAAMEA
jgi:putative DNA-invertase from lambdoid prophage Rac